MGLSSPSGRFRGAEDVRVLGKGQLEAFSRTHPQARSPVRSWLAEAEEAQWNSPADVLARFPRASVIAGDRIVFKLGGNKYRMDARIDFERKLVLIERVGTHAEYGGWTF